MDAVILAGGEGRRLRPYTHIIPKPLVPVGDKAILEILMDQLIKSGFDKIHIAVGYKAEYIQTFLDQMEKYKGKAFLSKETIPLDTAGPLKLVQKNITGDFIVVNGDTLSDINYSDLLNHHKKSKNMATIASYNKKTKIELGVIKTDGKGYVTKYVEKPTYQNMVSTGIYAFKPEVLDYIKEGEKIGLPDLIRRIILNKHTVGTYEIKGTWMDLGRFEDYNDAMDFYENNKHKF